MTEVSMLLPWLAALDVAERFYGVVVAIVTNNDDPDKLGRIKVKFPWLPKEQGKEVESDWARVPTLMAGADRGFYCLPEVDDEVLVAFEHGDLRFPYVIGSLWNGKDKPPVTNSDGKNSVRMLKSRSGHTIRLDDTDNDEKIEIRAAGKKQNRIVLSTKNNSITITADADITIESTNGKLKLRGQAIEITSQAGIKIEASRQLDLKADQQLNVKGQTVNIN